MLVVAIMLRPRQLPAIGALLLVVMMVLAVAVMVVQRGVDNLQDSVLGEVDLDGMSTGFLDPFGFPGVGFGDEDDFDPIADQATPEEILGPNFQPAVLEPGAWAPEETAPTLRNLKFDFAGEYYSGFGPAPIIGCEREGTGALKK